MTWHPIEQHRYRDAVRRWHGRPCAARPASSSTRAASRVEGLGVRLVVVDARTHTAVTDPLDPSPHRAGGSVTASDLAGVPIGPRQEDRAGSECGRGPATPPSPEGVAACGGGVAPRTATGPAVIPEPAGPVAPTYSPRRTA